MKILEDNVLDITMKLERLKNERDKFVTKVDKKEINKKIDKVCEKVFQNFIEKVES